MSMNAVTWNSRFTFVSKANKYMVWSTMSKEETGNSNNVVKSLSVIDCKVVTIWFNSVALEVSTSIWMTTPPESCNMRPSSDGMWWFTLTDNRLCASLTAFKVIQLYNLVCSS